MAPGRECESAGERHHGRPGPGPPGTPASTDPLFDHTVATWLTDMGVLLLLAVVLGLLAWRRLVTMRPPQRR
jgi:hypothetical protein